MMFQCFTHMYVGNVYLLLRFCPGFPFFPALGNEACDFPTAYLFCVIFYFSELCRQSNSLFLLAPLLWHIAWDCLTLLSMGHLPTLLSLSGSTVLICTFEWGLELLFHSLPSTFFFRLFLFKQPESLYSTIDWLFLNRTKDLRQVNNGKGP